VIALVVDTSALTNRQILILKFYKEKLNTNEISQKMRLNKSAVYREVQFLIQNNYTDQVPKIKVAIVNNPIVELPDNFLKDMVLFDFTPAQKEFILSNANMSRTELAKALKINKSFFNYALHKNSIIIKSDLGYE
jgi:predicted transcriptional regulator